VSATTSGKDGARRDPSFQGGPKTIEGRHARRRQPRVDEYGIPRRPDRPVAPAGRVTRLDRGAGAQKVNRVVDGLITGPTPAPWVLPEFFKDPLAPAFARWYQPPGIHAAEDLLDINEAMTFAGALTTVTRYTTARIRP